MSKWVSRKFLVMIVGVILNLLQSKFGIPQDVIDWINKLLLGWIGTEGVIDSMRMFKKENSE